MTEAPWAHLPPSEKRRIVVLGYIIRMPLGALVWHYLQFAMGLARMGHVVYYLEDSCFFEDDDASWFYDPVSRTMGTSATNGLQAAKEIFERVGLGERWALYQSRESEWVGPALNVREICASADIVMNVSVANPLRGPLRQIPVRAFIDTDPLFTQVRILTNPIRKNQALQHTCFFTLGENIASGKSTVPPDGFPWKPLRQPMVLDAWPVGRPSRESSFTTLMAWDSFAGEEYDGRVYGMKSDSFETVLELPAKSGQRFELGLFDPSSAPPLLKDKGWFVVDGKQRAPDPWRFQDYVRDSKAEFSVAKQGYVASRCGWFSDRSAAYL